MDGQKDACLAHLNYEVSRRRKFLEYACTVGRCVDIALTESRVRLLSQILLKILDRGFHPFSTNILRCRQWVRE